MQSRPTLALNRLLPSVRLFAMLLAWRDCLCLIVHRPVVVDLRVPHAASQVNLLQR